MSSVPILFLPQDQTVSVPVGSTLLEAARLAGIELRCDCAGVGVCRKCRIVISHLAETSTQSSPSPSTVCACQVVTTNVPMTVTIPPDSILTDGIQIVSHTDGLDTEFSVDIRSDTHADTGLPTDNRFQMNRNGRFAVAVDIGTTTLVTSLVDVELATVLATVARRNPQTVFGSDVISRLHKVQENAAQLAVFQSQLRTAINGMIRELVRQVPGSATDITHMVVAGNTVMQHFFLGLDTSTLGVAPFLPAVKTYPVLTAAQLGIEIFPTAAIWLTPLLGGFVGGDISAGILATRLRQHPKPVVFMDVGTNGEMAVSADGRLFVAATAAGPAFEGAGIRCGMMAMPGAICHATLRQDRQNDGFFDVQTIGNVPARGICGSGLVDIIAELVAIGVITSTGKMRPATIPITTVSRGAAVDVMLTQQDVRHIQLAVGAMRCGLQVLLNQVALKVADIDRFYLAGGFGYHLLPENIRKIGLVPRELPSERLQICGNTSLLGAVRCAVYPNDWDTAQQLPDYTTAVDLAAAPNFSSMFTESMTTIWKDIL